MEECGERSREVKQQQQQQKKQKQQAEEKVVRNATKGREETVGREDREDVCMYSLMGRKNGVMGNKYSVMGCNGELRRMYVLYSLMGRKDGVMGNEDSDVVDGKRKTQIGRQGDSGHDGERERHHL